MSTISYNYTLFCGVISWCAAQIIKTVINFIQTRKFHAERLLGAGGMPSSHSALVCSATAAVFRDKGFGSVEFAIMFIIAMIVMYDAMGVRRSAGLQAREINRINRLISLKKEPEPAEKKEPDKKSKKQKELKEYLGHTPFEVLGGAVLGVLIAMLLPTEI